MFNYKIDPINSNRWATIGVNSIISKGILIVIWSYTDDEGRLHTKKLNNLIYFPDSPANILSAIELAESMNYYKGTWVLTKIKYHIFTWDFGKY